jgi:methyltransferase
MELSRLAFLALLAGVALSRLVELVVSRRHENRLRALGAVRLPDTNFHWMVLLHTGILAGAALEVLGLHRRFIPELAVAMVTVFVLGEALRWWVIWTLGGHWNVHVVNSTHLGVVSHGPFRFVRHPNYLAVFVELIALPLIHFAWLTALLGMMAHIWVLSHRVALEESMLFTDPRYRAAMGHKPRFVPHL